MKTHMQNLWDSAEYSDLIIHSGDATFKVHRAIVSRCAFFDGACRHGFKEAHLGLVEMNNDEAWAVRALLQYLYTSDYEDSTFSSVALPSFHVGVYVIADKYNVPDLKVLAARKFGSLVDQKWEDDEDFKLDLLDAIQYIYSNTLDTDHRIRDIAVLTVQKHASELLNADLAGNSVYRESRELLSACPEFAIDLALANATTTMAKPVPVIRRDTARRTMLDEYLAWTKTMPTTQPPNYALYDSDDEQAFV